VPRRIHTSQVRAGELTVSDREAHHARDVLRLSTGEPVELFDDAGTVARGTIVACDARSVVVRVEEVAAEEATPAAIRLTLAAAVPKGDRADWMIEKLSELGVERFIPLATARSVVLPEGRNKRDRWTRIATEAAKQSQRRGVMRIDELTKLDVALGEAFDAGARWVLSTTGEAQSVIDLVAGRNHYTIDGTLILMPQVRAGKLRPIATGRAERWPELPDVPTLVESGYPDFTLDAWTGVVAPHGTPEPIIASLNAAITKGLQSQEAKTALDGFSSLPKTGTPAEFGAFIAEQGKRWGALVKLAGAKVE
jgi:RsmE family RNA methyltransferase